MAETFKNIRGVGTTSYTTIYTVPTGKTSLILGFQMTNINASAVQTAGVQWLDSSGGNPATRLAENTPVPIGGAINAIEGKIVLEAGDALQVKCGTANQVEFTGSVLEIG